MTPREYLPADEYAKIKAEETRLATDLSISIKNSKDKFTKFKDQRPVIDLRHMFETSTELYGDRPAFYEKPTHKDPYKAITYKEAKAVVDALSTALHAHDMRGRRIAVIGENGFKWASAYLSVVCGVGIVVPLDKELNTREVETLLIESESVAIFYSKKYESMMADIKKAGNTKLTLYINMDGEELADYEVSRDALIKEGEALLAAGNRDCFDAQILADEMGILIFTSGTTGIAKGVMLSHHNICTDLMIPPSVMGIFETDIFFSVLPMHHTYEGTCGFLIPLYRGAAIAYCEGLKYIVNNLAEAKPTVFLAVPLIFENLYSKIWQNVRKQGKEKLLKTVIKINRQTKKIGIDLGKAAFKDIHALFGGNMRLCIVGGAAIDPAIIDGICDLGINMLQGYGLSECAPICALNPWKGGKSSSAGYLIPGFEGKIEDADPETGIGEICVAGSNVMLGYYNNPEATAEVMEGKWFHTGDYGYIDKDDFVFITGRKKNVIITKNGKNVFPEELEYLLGRLDVVQESMVWEGEGGRDDTIIIATIRPNTEVVNEKLGDNYTEEDLSKLIWAEVDTINNEIALFKRIKKIVIRHKEFDVTTSKKIRRFNAENKEGVEI